jgi:hypothetical protein
MAGELTDEAFWPDASAGSVTAATAPRDKTAAQSMIVVVRYVASRLGKGVLENQAFLTSIRARNRFVVWSELSVRRGVL